MTPDEERISLLEGELKQANIDRLLAQEQAITATMMFNQVMLKGIRDQLKELGWPVKHPAP